MNSNEERFDLIGCGFGPANLALSVAIAESWLKEGRESSPLKRVCFIEKHPNFQWHPGMLLPDTIMQISCLKDLATLRNPASPFTFLSYLHDHNRLVSFINRGTLIPTRREYADYLNWAALKVEAVGIEIFYGEEVTSLEALDQDAVRCISQKDGECFTRVTSNLIIAPGGAPRIPRTFATLPPSPTIFHTSVYAQSIEAALNVARTTTDKPLRICVIGSGQSAAEVLLDVHSRLRDLPAAAVDEASIARHEIDLIIRKGSLKPSDDSPFSNEVFDPISTDEIYNLPTDQSRKRLLAGYQNTNYSVVNSRTLDILYEHMYNQKVEEGAQDRSSTSRNSMSKALQPYIRILNNQSVIDTSNTMTSEGLPFGITLALQHTLTRQLSESRVYDIMILATGYERKTHVKLLDGKGIAEKFGLESTVSSQDVASPLQQNGVLQELTEQEVNALADSSGLELVATPPSVTSSGTSLGTSMVLSSATSSDGTQRSLLSRLNITRNYRLVSKAAGNSPRIYLQGCSEATHGISETLLSVVSVRAGEILGDILEGCSQ